MMKVKNCPHPHCLRLKLKLAPGRMFQGNPGTSDISGHLWASLHRVLWMELLQQ